MPFRSHKDDDGRKKLGHTLSQFFGRSKSRAPSPSPVPSGSVSPSVPTFTIPPLVQPPVGPTLAAEPSTSSQDPCSTSSVPLSFVYGKINIPKSRLSPAPTEHTHAARSPSITVTPPAQPTSPA